MRWLKAAVVALGAVMALAPSALAQDGAVKIGVLDDMSGPYSTTRDPATCSRCGWPWRISGVACSASPSR